MTHAFRYEGVQLGRRLQRCQSCDEKRATPIDDCCAVHRLPGGERVVSDAVLSGVAPVGYDESLIAAA
jgi:hypothetical protein